MIGVRTCSESMFGVSYPEFPALRCMRSQAGQERHHHSRPHPLALQSLRRIDHPVTPGHHPQSTTQRIPGMASRRPHTHPGGLQRPHLPPRHLLVLEHRDPTTGPRPDTGRSGDPRRHLLPVLVPADRHRRPPRHRLAMVRPREEDRLAADPRAPPRPDRRRHRRRHRPARRDRRTVAHHPHPTLLLPHLPGRTPPPTPSNPDSKPPAKSSPSREL